MPHLQQNFLPLFVNAWNLLSGVGNTPHKLLLRHLLSQNFQDFGLSLDLFWNFDQHGLPELELEPPPVVVPVSLTYETVLKFEVLLELFFLVLSELT